MIHKTKYPRDSFYLYKRPEFKYETCDFVYFGVDTSYEDFFYTIAESPELDSTWLFVMFTDGTPADKVCSDVESILKNITHDGCRLAVDIMSLFNKESEQEQCNIVRVINEYFLCNSAFRHVLIPPICRPNDMQRLNVLSSVQTLCNELNIQTATPPNWSFRWLMRQNLQKKLVHVAANWTDGGACLSRVGSKKYLHSISRYLVDSICAGLRVQGHDLTCRIQPVKEVGEGDAVPGPSTSSGAGRGSRSVPGGRSSGGVQRGGQDTLRGVTAGRIDSRVQIATRRVSRELERLRSLRDFIVEDITRRHIHVFFENLDKKF